MNSEFEQLSDEVCELINENVKSGSRSIANKNPKGSVDETELESWLRLEVYESLLKNPNMRNVAGIRHIINKRSINYFDKEVVKYHYRNKSYNRLVSESGDGDGNSDLTLADSFLAKNQFNLNDVETNIDLYRFLDSLALKERQVVELTAGFTDSLDGVQLARVKELIDRKSICACGVDTCQHSIKIWFTETEVGSCLGLTRRQVQYILEKMPDKAETFGLEMNY
jgi:hypothetical protein